jgi:hypothetical protein
MLKAMDEEDTEPMLRRQHILGQLDGVQRYHPFVLSVQHIISWVSEISVSLISQLEDAKS